MKGKDFALKLKMEGITQHDVAKKFGISAQAVQKWTRNKDDEAKIPPKYWEGLASMLDMPVEIFYPNTPNGPGNIANDKKSINQNSESNLGGSKCNSRSVSPIKERLIHLIETVATETYAKRQVAILEEVSRIISDE